MAIEQTHRPYRTGSARRARCRVQLVTAGTIEDAMLRIRDEKINMFELIVVRSAPFWARWTTAGFFVAGPRCLVAEHQGRSRRRL